MMFEHMPTDPPQEPPSDDGGDGGEDTPKKEKFPITIDVEIEFPEGLANNESLQEKLVDDFEAELTDGDADRDELDEAVEELNDELDKLDAGRADIDDVKRVVGKWLKLRE